MKTITITLFFAFISINLAAQCQYEKNEVDKFTGVEVKKLKEFIIGTNSDKTYGIALFKNTHPTGVSRGFYFYYRNKSSYASTRCFTSDTKITILLSDTSKIELHKLSNKIDCDSKFLMASFYLEEEDINKLSTANVTDIRIYFSEGYEDFSVESKKSNYFMNNLECVK